jgi:hypothetical protein
MAEKVTILHADLEMHPWNYYQVLSLVKDLLLKKHKIILCFEGLEKNFLPFLENLTESLREEIYITGDDPRNLLQLPKTKILALEKKFFHDKDSLPYLKSFVDFYQTNAFKSASEKTLLNFDLRKMFNRNEKSLSVYFTHQKEALEKLFAMKNLTIVCDFIPQHLQSTVIKLLPHIKQLVCLRESFMTHEKILHNIDSPLETALFVVNDQNALKHIFSKTAQKYSIIDHCLDDYEFFETQSVGCFLGHETVFKYLANGSLHSFETL